MTIPETVPSTDAPRPSRYSLGSLSNMLRSLLFIGLFVALLVGTVVIVGALTFFPALSLSPIVEHFLMLQGRLF